MVSRLDKGGKSLYYCDLKKDFILNSPPIKRIIPVKETIKIKKSNVTMVFCKKCGVNYHTEKCPNCENKTIPKQKIKQPHPPNEKGVNFAVTGCPSSGTKWLMKICQDHLTTKFQYINLGDGVPSSHRTNMIVDYLHESENKVIHIIRDGRDVVASRIKAGRGFEKLESFTYKKHLKNKSRHIIFAHAWNSFVEEGIKSRNHKNYLEIKYEDLILDFDNTFNKITEFFKVSDSSRENIREGIKIDPINRRRELPKDQLNEITKIMKPMLIKLGYENQEVN